MNEARVGAASVVFNERLVVSGGLGNRLSSLNTVESYDVAADKWTHMPNMRERRSGHSLVVVKSKLFVIGGTLSATSEIFDNNSKTFVTLKSPRLIGYNKSLSIGSKIFIFQTKKEDNCSVITYDVRKDKWAEEPCEAIANLPDYSCLKLAIYIKQCFKIVNMCTVM